MQSKRNLAILVINYSGRGGGGEAGRRGGGEAGRRGGGEAGRRGGVGVWRILEDRMVFTGNRRGISRRQRV